MNTIKVLHNHNRHNKHNRRALNPIPGNSYRFPIYIGFLIMFVCVFSLTVAAQTEQANDTPTSADTQESTEQVSDAPTSADADADDTPATTQPTKEIITGTSKRMESYEQKGITILIDEAKTVRRTEQGIEIGYLNADRITLKRDLETGETKEIVAEGNVEIRDQDIFATCDHAVMDNLTSTIILQENVVVLQNRDRLETVYFTFNRITGRQTAEGDVKFKVTITQASAPPPDEEAEVPDTEVSDADEAVDAQNTAVPDTEPESADAQDTETADTADETQEAPVDPENPEEGETQGEIDTPEDTEPNPQPETPEGSEGDISD